MKETNHVAIILDGNGRWATKRGLSRSMGHKAGFDNLKKLSKHIFKKGIKILSVFAFLLCHKGVFMPSLYRTVFF
jgi:undecaprenyl diphosphate synthase